MRIRLRNPFRLRFWVVYDNLRREHVVIRKRFRPRSEYVYTSWGCMLIDGPFDTNEDAARSLAFWVRQYESV